MPTVDTFLPSTSGLHFQNWFPTVPLKTVAIDFLGVSLRVNLGDASKGLCGGMVYTVCDYFESGRTPPPDKTAPGDGPLFDYIVNRLFDSWDVPAGIVRYLDLMRPDLLDHDVKVGGMVIRRGYSSIIINDEWPKVKDDLDRNHLSPLGVIKCKSIDPGHLGLNHQVLAYGYDLVGTDLTLKIYDPNEPDNDDARISLNLVDPTQSCQIECTTAPTVHCFFRSTYAKSGPPPAGITIVR